MKSRFKSLALIVTLLSLLLFVFSPTLFGWLAIALRLGSFDYSGTQITADILARCPRYIQSSGTRVLRVRNDEGITGSQQTIKLELPASQLQQFIAATPFRDVMLRAEEDSSPFPGETWLSPEHRRKVVDKKAFLTATLRTGQAYDRIFVDCSRSDVYVVYLRYTSG